ncbi:DUF5134 domain-containing protein [Streptomyces sp. SPB074]|uniref:DUF5134 domain-containing protein n=1 Tax=Streptomyces sp. (strain SPB074) TaxID=465543 RepID=UPI00017F1B41|nr:DUF5134 domain-containing protein [Streptomyces sp. SPB074]EDY44815.1 integral membrane protein [Streptomyces sp. SPB074]
MHAPGPAAWLLVALCAATSAYCLLRMRHPARGVRSTAGGEALMGFAMAVMAVPAAVLRPPAWAWLCYAVVFGLAALRALWAARAGSAHHAHHLVGTLAMVYMAWAMASAPAGHAGHGGGHMPGGTPLVTGLLLVYYAAYVLWTGARLVPAAVPAGPAPTHWTGRGEMVRACRLAMATGMLAMLLTV